MNFLRTRPAAESADKFEVVDIPAQLQKRLNSANQEAARHHESMVNRLTAASSARLERTARIAQDNDLASNMRRCGKRLTGYALEVLKFAKVRGERDIESLSDNIRSYVRSAWEFRGIKVHNTRIVKEIELRTKDARRISYDEVRTQIAGHPQVVSGVELSRISSGGLGQDNTYMEFVLDTYYISDILHEQRAIPKNEHLNGGEGFKPIKMFPVRVLFNPKTADIYLSHPTEDEPRFTNRMYTNGGVHPHMMSNGNPCLGDFGPAIQGAITAHDFRAAVDVLMMWLSTVNLDDAAGRSFLNYMASRMTHETGVSINPGDVLAVLASKKYAMQQGSLVQDDETGKFSFILDPVKQVEMNEMNEYIRSAIATAREAE